MIPTEIANIVEALQKTLGMPEDEAIKIAWAIRNYWYEKGVLLRFEDLVPQEALRDE